MEGLGIVSAEGFGCGELHGILAYMAPIHTKPRSSQGDSHLNTKLHRVLSQFK